MGISEKSAFDGRKMVRRTDREIPLHRVPLREGPAQMSPLSMNSQNIAHLEILKKLSGILALLLTAGFGIAALPQVRPTILDSGEVNESRKQSVTVDRSKVGSTRASKPANSILIILTEPKAAEVRIDGKLAGKAIDGRFKKELLTRKRYSISVSAGPDYEPYNEVVTMKPREPAIVEAVLSSKFGTLRIFPAKEGVKNPR